MVRGEIMLVSFGREPECWGDEKAMVLGAPRERIRDA